MADVEIRTIAFSSALEETPESFYAMERLRRAHELAVSKLTPFEREIHQAIDREIDSLILGYNVRLSP
jgi:hypothetical protein